MKTSISDNMKRIVILDISGIYVQIFEQGYFSPTDVEVIKEIFCDEARWKVIELEIN